MEINQKEESKFEWAKFRKSKSFKHLKRYKINYNKITICIILLFVLSFSFLFFNLKGNTINAGQVTVFIDPGHGGSDTGCIQNGYLEKDIDLKISLKLKGILEGAGYRVIMRRTNDSGMSMQDIVNMANSSGANLFVSVHCNSALSPDIQGIETYWSASNPSGGSSQLATSIHNAVVQATGRPGRVLRSAEFVVIKYTTMPAALVECGFLSNPDEAKLLASDDYQNRAAQGIANGIHAYVNSAGVSGSNAATTAAGEKLTGDVLINIDTPTNNQTVSGVINLEGWAIDKSATVTTGISAVHVYDGPANGTANFIGQATLGIARPDVAAAFGKGNLAASGFKLAINTASLAKGTHVLHVYANNAAVGWKYTTVVINVVNDGSAPVQNQTQTQTQTQTQAQATTQNTQQTSAATGVNADGSYSSSGTKRVLINIDNPKNGAGISGRLKIEGWALETSAQTCTGITAIHVYDGPANGAANFIGQATYGLPRPDVANSLGGRAGFVNSGFIGDFDISKLSAGIHNIYVYANNYYLGWQYAVVQINVGGTTSAASATSTSSSSSTSTNTSGQQFVKVAGISGTNPDNSQSSGSGKVLINIDTPKANESVNGVFTLAGWAIETSSTNSTGITAIHIYDGPANGAANFIGQATYGISRPDVAAYYGKANFANSGFSTQINTSKLSNGTHTLYVYAYNYTQGWKWATININVGGSSGGNSTQIAGITQTSTSTGSSSGSSTATQSVNVSGAKLILINIDTPSNNSSVGGGFEISGWAADRNSGSGTGINMVHVYDGPANGPQNMIGVASYGIARSDVSAAFGNGNITNCGFKIKVDSSRLTQGQHTIYIYANNPEIGWKYATLTLNITSGGTGGTSQSSSTTVAGGQVSGATNIVGYVPVSANQLLKPFVIRNSNQIDRARRLADLYIKWGQAFNIRADIAWAQMCQETGFLQFGGIAQPSWNNFAGIGITGPGAVVTFASEELGVIAHYAHLAWYVYPNDVNAYCNINYDPRHIGPHRYNGDSSLNCLYLRWATDPNYINKIVYIANQIWS